MQAPAAIIEQLNKLLYNELTAINQYFLHARMLENWGYAELGEKIYHESMGEMKHADRLVQRILFLDGLPNLQDLGKLRIGETVAEVLDADLRLEHTSRNDTASAIALFETQHDYVSRELAAKILIDSEAHIDYLEKQVRLMGALGEQNYLQSATGSLDDE
jgi:bacterioferritin